MKRALTYLYEVASAARKKRPALSALRTGTPSYGFSTVMPPRPDPQNILTAPRSDKHAVADVPPPELLEIESRIFDVLNSVVKDKSLGLTLRVAGGWVRDKLLLPQLRNEQRAEAASSFRGQVGLNPASFASVMAASSSDAKEKTEVMDTDSVDVDIDIALDGMMGEQFAEHVNEWLLENNYEAASYGVIASNPDQSKHLATARMKVLGVWLDIVNLRTETYAQSTSRIPDVEIGTPYEDAMRRDLTINALFYNINTGKIEDYTGRGVADIQARIIRTPLPPLTTLLDDPLRALRAIRFASRFNFRVDPELYDACAEPEVHDALGAKVSRERVSNEIDKMMSSATPAHAIGLLRELGLFSIVFRPPPETEYVGDERPPADFSYKALGCLINLDRLAQRRPFSVAATSPSDTSAHDKSACERTRIARYAALLSPVSNVSVMFGESPRKVRKTPLAQYILRHELRMSTKDVSSVVGIHEASHDFKRLVRAAFQTSHLDATPSHDTVDALATERLTLGMLVRSTGPLWRVALQTALISELSPAEPAETYARGMVEQPPKLSAEAELLVEAYAAFEKRIDSLKLDGVWNLKPVVDGNELKKLLPGLPRGPQVGQIMKAQVEHMIAQPDISHDGVRSWIVTNYSEYATR